MNLKESEFETLRRTIANRGTARMVVFPASVLGWSLAGVLAEGWAGPYAFLFSLGVLAAGFEAVHALHVGAERVGRYLQVFYEGTDDGPKWETTAMATGPALPGGGVDPLFTAIFALATVVNGVPALLRSSTRLETAALAIVHAALLYRILRARWAAARQRAVELESYQTIKSQHSGSKG